MAVSSAVMHRLLFAVSLALLLIPELFAQTARLGFDPEKDYAAVLNIDPQEDDEDVIKSAYRSLARAYHPDINKEPEAESKMAEAAEAYEVYSDPDKRRLYRLERARLTGDIVIKGSTAEMAEDEVIAQELAAIVLGILPEKVVEKDSHYIGRMKHYAEQLVDIDALTSAFLNFGDYGLEEGDERTFTNEDLMLLRNQFVGRFLSFIRYDNNSPKVLPADNRIARSLLAYDLLHRKYIRSTGRKIQRGRWPHFRDVQQFEIEVIVGFENLAQAMLLRNRGNLRRYLLDMKQQPEFWTGAIKSLAVLLHNSHFRDLMNETYAEELQILIAALEQQQSENARVLNRLSRACTKIKSWVGKKRQQLRNFIEETKS